MVSAEDPKIETNTEGVVRVCMDRPGLWNVRTLHIVPADAGSGADWDAHWATLVFQVPGRAGERTIRCAGSEPSSGSSGSPEDSAAVAAVVNGLAR